MAIHDLNLQSRQHPVTGRAKRPLNPLPQFAVEYRLARTVASSGGDDLIPGNRPVITC